MILFGVWAPSEQVFWDTWIAAGICAAPHEYLPPYAGCVDTTAGAWAGIVYKNGVPVPGWHVNVRVYGDVEELMRAGKPQCDAEGNPLDLWQSTRATEIFQLSNQPADAATGFPAGMRAASGVTYADARAFSSPSNVWA